MSERSTRADGAQSRAKILAAATQLAAAYGYQGVTMKAVIELSGLPSSSVYWHFANKDDLLAAVITTDWERWEKSWQLDDDNPDLTGEQRIIGASERTAALLTDSPVFLQLGMRLVMDRHTNHPKARAAFLATRPHAEAVVARTLTTAAPGLTTDDAQRIAAYAIAGADGLFVRHLTNPHENFTDLFVMHGLALYYTARHMIGENQ